MAFTGSPVVVQLNDQEIRITGVDLQPLAAGTIGLFGASGGAPDITLPATFKSAAYTFRAVAVGLQDAVNVTINPASAGALTNLQPSVAKTGTTVADFRITVTNTNATTATQTLEIVIKASRPQTSRPAQLA